jgi:hypothetical protein
MNKLHFITGVIFLPCMLFGQNYLAKEKEDEIKVSGKYFWSECSAFKEDEAKQCALTDLSNRVIEDVINQSRKKDEVLKIIEMNANFDQLPQKGKIKILAWIAKDNVFVTTRKSITQTPAPIVQPPVKKEPAPAPVIQPQPAPVSEPETVMNPVVTKDSINHQTETIINPVATKDSINHQTETIINPVATDDPVLKKLLDCKTYEEVKRVVTINGFVRGSKLNSSAGFANPEKCIIAVFTANGALLALLDKGSSSRTNLLSGKTVQNPEQYYNREEHYLWYLQQKK